MSLGSSYQPAARLTDWERISCVNLESDSLHEAKPNCLELGNTMRPTGPAG